MHEVGIMQSALDLAIAEAQRAGADRIHRVAMRIGDLSGVVPEALSFAFEALTLGTPAEGACLDIERVPVVCRCPNCGGDFRPDDIIFVCPGCGRLCAETRQGKEIELSALEVS